MCTYLFNKYTYCTIVLQYIVCFSCEYVCALYKTVTNCTAGSAAISALGDISNPNQSCQSTNGSEPTGAADVLGPAKLWARRTANSRGPKMVCDDTPRKSRGGGLDERERPRGGKNCPSEPSGSTSGRSNIELEIAVAEWVGVGDELDVTTGSAPSAAEAVSATRDKLGRGGISWSKFWETRFFQMHPRLV